MTFVPAPQLWFALEITASPEAAEALEYALDALGALGTEINHLRKTNSDAVTVIGYFNSLPEEGPVRDEIHYALRIHDLREETVITIERREVENTDWLLEWKKHWKPTEVAGFIIAPPWEDVNEPDKIVISIEPNMAFGTGTHDTTQLCLEAIRTHYRPGESFLDVGTGTGILAIAAAKLAGLETANIYACDTDADSITIARDNAKLNAVHDAITFEVASLMPATPVFDFVCANLTLDVILPNLSLLIEKSRRMLVLSGILGDQETEILSALSTSECSDITVRRSGEWIAVIVPRASQ